MYALFKKGRYILGQEEMTNIATQHRSDMFKIIIGDLLYNLQKSDILASPQSGLIPGGASVNQLAFLYTVFYQAVDTGNGIQSFSVTQVKFLIVLGICFHYGLQTTSRRVILPEFTSN